MLRGHRFGSDEALKMGLINFSGDNKEVDIELEQLINDLLTAGPKALTATKELILNVVNDWSLDEAKMKTAQWIAEIRASDEGQEGMKAFFDKRSPNWKSK
jgi:methylglutaconyl-CoA hydratase